MSEDVRAFLSRHGLAPRKAHGQNFLHDAALADALVRRAGVRAEDAVLEVGTGLGILTRALAARARRVTSLEIDAGLVRALHEEQRLPGSVKLVHADALRFDLAAALHELGAPQAPVRLVANLPYRSAAPLLRRIFDLGALLCGVAVMVQRETAVRLSAETGARDYGSLTILRHWLFDIEARFDLSGRAFHPVPRVVSSFVVMRPHRPPRLSPEEAAAFEKALRAGFAHRRKTLVNSLARAGAAAPERAQALLAAAGHGPRVRAQELSPEAWLALARGLQGR